MAEFGNNYNFGDSPLFKDEGWEPWPPETTVDELFLEGDIRLIPDIFGADINMADRDLERDPTLETATLVSLFTDKRARVEDITPDRNEDRRGWFGDAPALNIDNDEDGSWLWLLYRSKTLDEVLTNAVEYAQEALAWMISDGLAERTETEAVRGEADHLLLTVRIYRPGTVNPELYRYYYNWKAQVARKVD